MEYLSGISIAVSIIALILSGLSWHKSRVIYGLERMKFAKDPGDSRNDEEKRTDNELLKKLNTGKYTIVNSYESGNWNIFVLGRIKKKK